MTPCANCPHMWSFHEIDLKRLKCSWFEYGQGETARCQCPGFKEKAA